MTEMPNVRHFYRSVFLVSEWWVTTIQTSTIQTVRNIMFHKCKVSFVFIVFSSRTLAIFAH